MSMFAIASQVVTGNTTNTITFNNIPQTYAHLEIKSFIPNSSANSGGVGNIWWYPNGAALSNGTIHEMNTNVVSSVTSGAATGLPWVRTGYQNYSAAFPIVSVSTVLDYSSTVKFKTAKYVGGSDTNANTNPYLQIGSGLIQTNSPITSMTFGIDNGYFAAGTRIDLYGINVAPTVTGV